ncbi:hypothetical protein Tco_1224871, partial [Tanacetum coccineum]
MILSKHISKKVDQNEKRNFRIWSYYIDRSAIVLIKVLCFVDEEVRSCFTHLIEGDATVIMGWYSWKLNLIMTGIDDRRPQRKHIQDAADNRLYMKFLSYAAVEIDVASATEEEDEDDGEDAVAQYSLQAINNRMEMTRDLAHQAVVTMDNFQQPEKKRRPL